MAASRNDPTEDAVQPGPCRPSAYSAVHHGPELKPGQDMVSSDEVQTVRNS